MRLFLTELRRGWARRSTRVLLVLAVVLILILGVTLFATSSADLDASGAAGLREHAAQIEDCIRNDAYGAARTGAANPSDEELRSSCSSMIGPAHQYVDDPRFHLTTLWPSVDEGGDGVLVVSCLFLVLGALIGGATFIGADWRFGTIGTLLSWEPRRTRVFLGKAAAVALWSFVVGLVLQSLVGLAVLPSAIWRGTTDGADAAWFGEVVAAILRTSALGAAAALLGYGVASIGRNTAAALGVAFGYVAIAESVMRGLRPGWQRWFVSDNAVVVLLGRQLPDAGFERTAGGAGIVLLCYLSAVLLAAGVTFARRDIG